LLLVEDDRDAADTFGRLLELTGHRVVVTYDGRGALDAAAKGVFDAVLCDLSLGGDLDGRDVARALRRESIERQSSGPLLIAVTGYQGRAAEEQSLAAGFHAHVTKPVDLSRLEMLFDRARQAVG
jgi:CheY-like chemotaxis protein